MTAEHQKEADTLIVDELGLCEGQARVDLAVINGSIHGYEIKSDRDSLERLSNQAPIYNRTLERVTFVAAQRHLPELQRSWPRWWGLSVIAYDFRRGVVIEDVRAAQQNQDVDGLSVAQLLWRQEALAVLRELGLDTGFSRKSREKIWAVLACEVSREDLQRIVAERLRKRTGWRAPTTSQRTD